MEQDNHAIAGSLQQIPDSYLARRQADDMDVDATPTKKFVTFAETVSSIESEVLECPTSPPPAPSDISDVPDLCIAQQGAGTDGSDSAVPRTLPQTVPTTEAAHGRTTVPQYQVPHMFSATTTYPTHGPLPEPTTDHNTPAPVSAVEACDDDFDRCLPSPLPIDSAAASDPATDIASPHVVSVEEPSPAFGMLPPAVFEACVAKAAEPSSHVCDSARATATTSQPLPPQQYVTPQNAYAAAGPHPLEPPKLFPAGIIASVSSAEDHVPAAPVGSPATSVDEEDSAMSSGDEGYYDEDMDFVEGEYWQPPNWDVEILCRGQMAIVCRDLKRHVVEKRVSVFDQNGMPTGAFAAKRDLLHAEYAAYRMIGEHPCIVRVLDIVDTAGYCSILMEDLVEQRYEPLMRLLEDGRAPALSGGDIANIIGGVCEALSVVHEKNLLHGDLSVKNVMVKRGPSGDVVACKLVDLNGFVQLSGGHGKAWDWVGAESISPPEADVSSTGKCMLSPYPADYVRPSYITTAADMWSVGRLIWMMAKHTLYITNDLNTRELTVDELPAGIGPLFVAENGAPGPLLTLQQQLVRMAPEDRPDCIDVLSLLDDLQLW